MVSGAPEFGEQTEEILSEIGYSQQEIAQFRQTGAI
jgi:crotonobetainyl-CoA:carnitine CoA-transferase CaiB-like acyl-CoA transferase